MSRVRYGVPMWLDTVPKARRPSFLRFRGDAEVDVAIVGGSLAGCFAAYLIAREGASVLLLEPDRVLDGGAVGGCGWTSREPLVSARVLRERLGLKAARIAFEATRKASAECAALMRRLRIRGAYETTDAVVITRDQEGSAAERERRARSEVGLGGTWLNARRLAELGLEAASGLKLSQEATLNAYALGIGVLRAAVAEGATVHEESELRRVRHARRHEDLFLAGGRVRARRVLVATSSLARGPYRALARHMREVETFVAATTLLPGAVTRAVGAARPAIAVGFDRGIRLAWTNGPRLVIEGGHQPPVPDRQRLRVLEQRTGDLMYNLLVRYPSILGTRADYGWAERRTVTPDGLCYAGPHRNFPHHLFAVAVGHGGVTAAYLAARIAARHHLGTVERDDRVFGFLR
jgi:gamma-glutamylputrescine oxidase